jgi:transcriptional regulator with XRE-family HTH domain
MEMLEKIVTLMNQRNCDNQQLATALGLNRQVVTDWKAGRSKSYLKYLPKIAAYFDVTMEFLLSDEKIGRQEVPLSAREQLVVDAYRAHPELQAAVDRMLGIEMEGYVRLYTAAQSTDNHPEEIIYMRKDRWEQMQQAPETDEKFS